MRAAPLALGRLSGEDDGDRRWPVVVYGDDGERGCPGGPAAHQEHETADGEARVGRTATMACANGGGRRRRRPGRRLRFERPRYDSLDQRVEDGEAETLVRFDLLHGLPNGGDERGTAAGRR